MNNQATQQQLIQADLHAQGSIEPQHEVDKRVDFLCNQMLETGQHALVLGISGGVDSTVAGRLAQLAVERPAIKGVTRAFMPCGCLTASKR